MEHDVDRRLAATTHPLTALSFPPASGGPPRQIVVFLHGYGADGEQAAPCVRRWAESLPDAEFLAPHGPAACKLQPEGREWFGLTSLPGPLLERARATAPLIDAFLDEALARRGLGPEKLALTGFSQGAVMSLYVGPRRRPSIGAIVSFAGVLVGEEDLSEIGDLPRILLVQGEKDRMVRLESMQAAHAALRARRARPEHLIREGMQHEIDDVVKDAAGAFLREALGG
jgi:phospholipase/carboxylesterase